MNVGQNACLLVSCTSSKFGYPGLKEKDQCNKSPSGTQNICIDNILDKVEIVSHSAKKYR